MFMLPFDKGPLKEKAFRLVFSPFDFFSIVCEGDKTDFEEEQADSIAGIPIMDARNFLRWSGLLMIEDRLS